jgi:hypothetical protein
MPTLKTQKALPMMDVDRIQMGRPHHDEYVVAAGCTTARDSWLRRRPRRSDRSSSSARLAGRQSLGRHAAWWPGAGGAFGSSMLWHRLSLYARPRTAGLLIAPARVPGRARPRQKHVVLGRAVALSVLGKRNVDYPIELRPCARDGVMRPTPATNGCQAKARALALLRRNRRTVPRLLEGRYE